MREGAPLYAGADATEAIGRVTSGGFSPSLQRPVAMGYLPSAQASDGTLIFAEVRGQRLAMTVAPMPFIQNTYKR